MDPLWIVLIVVVVLLVVLALVLLPRARRKERERKQLQAREHLQAANRLSAQAEADRASAEEQLAQARRERAEAELRAVEGERDAQQRLAEAERRQSEAQSLQAKAGRLDPRLRHDPRDAGSTSGDDPDRPDALFAAARGAGMLTELDQACRAAANASPPPQDDGCNVRTSHSPIHRSPGCPRAC